MNSCGGVDVQIHLLLTPVLFRELSASGLELFTPVEICSYVLLINYYAMKAYGGVDV
jgi:hypothetical protein